MANRKEDKRYRPFLHDFLFYATIIAYCALTSCFGARKELIPQINQTFLKLSEQAQKDYYKLFQMLNDDEKKQMEQTIKGIKNPDDLANFIEKNIEIYLNRNNISKLLTEDEQKKFQQQWKEANDIKDIDNQIKHKKALIAQYESKFKLIQDAPMPIQQYYIDLGKVLPEGENIKFKNDIAHADSLDKIKELIASKLPEPFKQLDDNYKEDFSQLPDERRQEILRNFITQSSTTALPPSYEEATGIKPPSYKEATAATQVLDLKKLIKQEIDDHQEQKEKDGAIPQDEWRGKLPLTGPNMEDFNIIMSSLGEEAKTSLKEFLDQAAEDSIEYISFVLYKSFNREQRTNLLRTIIYLYKKRKETLLKMCNKPKYFNALDKIYLAANVDNWQLNLLKKLNQCLEWFEQCDHDEEMYEKKYCH